MTRPFIVSGILAAFGLALAGVPVAAQVSEPELGVVVDRLSQVESELDDVQRALYAAKGLTGASARGIEGTTPDPALESLGQRVDALDTEVRRLTGQIEELDYRIRQLEANLPAGGDEEASSAPSGPGTPVSPNSAEGTGLAPPETVIGQLPKDTELPQEPQYATYQEQYQAALNFLRQQDYPRAELALKTFIAQHGETELAGPAMYWLGETYFAQDNYADAAQAYFDGLRNYPDSPKAPDSMLKLGMSLLPLGERTQACAAFKELPARYPNASETIKQRAKVEADRAGC